MGRQRQRQRKELRQGRWRRRWLDGSTHADARRRRRRWRQLGQGRWQVEQQEQLQSRQVRWRARRVHRYDQELWLQQKLWLHRVRRSWPGRYLPPWRPEKGLPTRADSEVRVRFEQGWKSECDQLEVWTRVVRFDKGCKGKRLPNSPRPRRPLRRPDAAVRLRFER